MTRERRKRLSIDIPTEMHDTLKKLAHKNYLTLTRYIIKVVKERMIKEKDLGNLEE